MDLTQAIILAVVEGITEFLPVSSTGHMILVSDMLGIVADEFSTSFMVGIQLGAILAVFMMYGKRFWQRKNEARVIATAFVPTAIVGFIGYKLIKSWLLESVWITGGALFVGGVMMVVGEKWIEKRIKPKKQVADLKWQEAATLGVFQSLSVIPGVSRALTSIWGGMYLGLPRTEAVEMSFMLAVPTMAAATAWDLLNSGWGFSGNEWRLLGFGFVTAFMVAWVVVKWFLKYVRSHSFHAFGWYRIALFVFLMIR